MCKNDFYVGQTVFLHNIYAKKNEELIFSAQVIMIGRKYITVEYGYKKYRFNIDNDFKQADVHSTHYVLYLSKDDIYADLEDKRERKCIQYAFDLCGANLAQKLSKEDKQKILAIIKKYPFIDNLSYH